MSSLNSSPSIAPIETSYCFFVFFLVHMFPLVSHRRVLLECIIVSYSGTTMFAMFANPFHRLIYEIDGQKSIMSNV